MFIWVYLLSMLLHRTKLEFPDLHSLSLVSRLIVMKKIKEGLGFDFFFFNFSSYSMTKFQHLHMTTSTDINYRILLLLQKHPKVSKMLYIITEETEKIQQNTSKVSAYSICRVIYPFPLLKFQVNQIYSSPLSSLKSDQAFCLCWPLDNCMRVIHMWMLFTGNTYYMHAV